MALAWMAMLLHGCSRAEDPDLRDLERLAFVPAGECSIQAGFGARVSCSNARPLLVDRFEVTRADWRAWRARERQDSDPELREFQGSWTAANADWPATFVTLVEARAFAISRGMRLLTAREWMRTACGTGERPFVYPWGGGKARSVANTLELELRNPVPVGTFEQGRTPLGIYDMAGNAWEWVEDPIATATRGGASELAWAMGGSYLYYLRRLYDDAQGLPPFYQQDLDPRSRAVDVGLRCCADAEEYLSSRAGRWSGPGASARLRAIGASWGPDSVPLLEELVRRPGAAAGLRSLLEGARP